MAKPEIEQYRYEESKYPMSKEDIARDKAVRVEEKAMLEREAQRLKEENSPKFKAEVEKAIRGNARSGGGSGAGVDIEGLPKKLKSGPKNFKKGGKVSSASKRADGCAIRGKTKGRFV